MTIVKPPSSMLTTVDAMPALRPASLETAAQPVTVQQPQANHDGSGAMEVTIENHASPPVLLRIRDASGKLVAEVHVAPGAPGKVRLDGGLYQTFVRVDLNGERRHLKGPLFNLPPGARGTGKLELQMQFSRGDADAFEVISPEEF